MWIVSRQLLKTREAYIGTTPWRATHLWPIPKTGPARDRRSNGRGTPSRPATVEEEAPRSPGARLQDRCCWRGRVSDSRLGMLAAGETSAGDTSAHLSAPNSLERQTRGLASNGVLSPQTDALCRNSGVLAHECLQQRNPHPSPIPGHRLRKDTSSDQSWSYRSRHTTANRGF